MRAHKTLVIITATLAVATVAGLIALWPRGESAKADFGVLYDATVRSVGVQPCDPTSSDATCSIARVVLDEGPDKGTTITVDAEGREDLKEGDQVVVAHYASASAIEAGVEYQLADRNRKAPLLLLALIFSVCVVVLGRLKGLAALAGLGASLVVLIAFVLPAILHGRPPVMVAVTGASAIAFISLYAAHGFTPKTTVALLGTLGGLMCALGLGWIFAEAATLSGFVGEDAGTLSLEAGAIDFRGLLLAGLVIGALGAIDDVSVTQASAVWELSEAGAPDLWRSAMRIGRDHVGSTVNTLVLAYAGASMSLLLLFSLSDSSVLKVANGELVATEIVRTLAGSIGLVASVPITTWLAVRVRKVSVVTQ